MKTFRAQLLTAALLSAAFAVPAALAHSTAATSHAAHGHGAHDAHDGHGAHDAHGSHGVRGAHEAHDHHAEHAQHDRNGKAAERALVRFADVTLTDQNGRAVRLERDVVGDRIVVADFVYTSCTTVCPVVSAIMSEVQSRLGDRVGRDVKLVSLTVDPARDTPARLREYAGTHGAGPGWTWLTGTSHAVNETLKGLGTWTPDFEDHPVVMMVGDGRTGEWIRFYGFTDPATLVAKVEEFSAARVATPAPTMTAAAKE